MTAAVARFPNIPTRPDTPPHSLSLNTSAHGSPTAVPNKHIPFCSPGAPPSQSQSQSQSQYGLISPPQTPPDKPFPGQAQSYLYPPDPHTKLTEAPPVYAIDGPTLVEALEQAATQPLPQPKEVFPWLHGLHPDNAIQLGFFGARSRSSRRVPRCLRGVTVVKVGGNLSHSKLKGAVAPEELLAAPDRPDEDPMFHDIDPRHGFSVRNFQIQACKLATVSDIIVYGDDSTPLQDVKELAQIFSQAQVLWRDEIDPVGNESEEYNTFAVTASFAKLETQHRGIVAIDSNGDLTGNVLDFLSQERAEMCSLSKASEISRNVWLGPTPDPALYAGQAVTSDDVEFDVLVEAGDFAMMPASNTLSELETCILNDERGTTCVQMEFPSSGSFAVSEEVAQNEDDISGLIQFCQWVYRLANPEKRNRPNGNTWRPRKVLIHCTDGYTETSLLGLAYYMFAEGLPAHEAWVRLHMEKQRNFFAYSNDKAFLEQAQPYILSESPHTHNLSNMSHAPSWMNQMDGSLPSRILPYLYLGNLNHAQNPTLLRRLGITRILSVGEQIRWSDEFLESWGQDNLLYIDNLQDNGVHALTSEFDRCLKFIEHTKKNGEATLVHCRVGVSRSATICIAEVMNELGLSFPRA
ncbi:MAG: tyrosine/serine/threonine protein phosphatase pps1 [Alyxoria varia]|nr:MAG: tyrosine/serine/threonine protein phosphatase pps1 [Alyxoria varia]